MSNLSITKPDSISKDYDSFACLLDTGKCVEVFREIRWPNTFMQLEINRQIAIWLMNYTWMEIQNG